MASKTTQARTKGSDVEGAGALRAEADRLIAKERYKDAVKQAKICYKEQATPEHHRLLERAYFLRARQLLQQGMRSSAVEVAQHLIDFGVTEPDAPEELVRLLAGLGFERAALSIQERMGRPELKEQVARTFADQLVIHPGRTGTASPELSQEAGLVRRALEALQGGDEAGASGILRDLPRSSALSEWKFFVRGLAAFERGDDGEARANWERLEAGRAPAVIASRLGRMAEEAAAGSGAGLEAAERLAFGEPILARLRQLGTAVAAHDWDRALALLGPIRMGLRRIDPALPRRLTGVLIGSVIKAVQGMDWHEARSLVERFCRVAEPTAIDPHWNRLWALIWDGPQAEPGGAIHYWSEYIEDLATLDAFGPAERALAQALVWNHIAELHREEWEALVEDEEGPPGLRRLMGGRKGKKKAESREVAAARKAVLSAVEKSLALAPDHLDTYRLLVTLHRDWEDDKGLVAAADRLLARFPEDVETLQLLARHHHDRKDPAAALPYVERARRLKPLDDDLRGLEWMTRVGLARAHALKRRWDQGRAEFAAAEALSPEDCRDFSYLVRKAMLEYRAGQDEAGDRYVEQAGALLVEPAPLWLALLAESVRFKMPKPRTDDYARRWDAELKKKKRSETAGEMAGLMGAYLKAGVAYTGRAGHVKKIVAYLRNTTTLKYRLEDIERVVDFLGEVGPVERALTKKLVNAGVKQYPDSVRLHLVAADVEITDVGLGLFFGASLSSGARRHLETALELAEASTDPRIHALLPMIRERLGRLDQVEQAMGHFGSRFGLPFGPGPGPGYDMFDDIDPDDFDEDFDEDEDGDEPFFGRLPGPPRRPGPSPPKGRRRKRK